jgi:hypothetical protein
VVTDDIGQSLDKLLLDATAGDLVRPPGLLYNIAAGTASVSTTPSEAMMEDVGIVVAAVSAVANNNPIILVCSPKQATELRLRAGPNFPHEVLSSSALADKTIMAVATNCLASAADPLPRFSITTETVLTFGDTTPTDITSGAVGATTKSLWQSDLWGLKTVLQIGWCLRSTSGVAWLQNVKWGAA